MMKLLRHARRQPIGTDGRRHARYAVIRNTYPELKTTTIKTWSQWVPQSVGRWRDQGPPSHHILDAGLDLEVLFIALDRPDDIAKLLSLELTGAWINEAREVPKAVLDALTGRVGRYPPVRDGGCVEPQIWMDTNSPDSDHWWYRLAEEGTPEEFAFFTQPGGLNPGAENLANLPESYYERACAGKDDDWVAVYVRSEYGYVREGKAVYPEYRDSVHCREFEISRSLPLWIGLDFGLTPAAVFGQRTAMGAWRWHSELVCEDMGAWRFGELLRGTFAERYPGIVIAGVTGDPAGDSRQPGDTDERTVFQILNTVGIQAIPAHTNDPVFRREAVAQALNRMVDGTAGLLIHPQCRMLRKAMAGAYAYRRVQISGEERYRDKPDKNMYSHVAEAAQYLMLGAGEDRTLVAPPVTSKRLDHNRRARGRVL
ncbi:MAG: TerL [Gammaproteobacteria bacterium]|nr:TerL [Gammaproteobacteria bacterium]